MFNQNMFLCQGGRTMWDLQAAIDHLNKHAGTHSHSQCAKFTRRAIEAGGLKLIQTLYAKDYGASLLAAGFVSQGALSNGFRAGDVAIIQPPPGHKEGHACMYNGHIWVSDFRQYHGFYPGAGYRKSKPSYVIYRYPGVDAASLSVDQAQKAAGR